MSAKAGIFVFSFVLLGKVGFMMLKEGGFPPAPKIACATDFLNYAAFSIMFFLAFRFYLVLLSENSPFVFRLLLMYYTPCYPGGGKKGVAIRPYPSPGPLPFIPNAFYMCEALPGFDSCWAVSRKEECKLGKKFLLAKSIFAETDNLT